MLKTNKPWCVVCNTTKHESSTCGKVIGYNTIVSQFISTIKHEPYCDKPFGTGEKYEKTFLKYAVNYLRKNGCYDEETNEYVFPDFKMKDNTKRLSHDTLMNYFIASLFQIRIKIRELREVANQCPICMESMRDKKAITTECGHKFCTKCYNTCIGKQLSQYTRATCPCCRRITVNTLALV